MGLSLWRRREVMFALVLASSSLAWLLGSSSTASASTVVDRDLRGFEWTNWTIQGGPYLEADALGRSLDAWSIPWSRGLERSYVYIPALKWIKRDVANDFVWTYDESSKGWMDEPTPACAEALGQVMPAAITDPMAVFGDVFDCYDTNVPGYKEDFAIAQGEGAGRGSILVNSDACRIFDSSVNNWCGIVLAGRLYKFGSKAPSGYNCMEVMKSPGTKKLQPWGFQPGAGDVCLPTPRRPGSYDYPIVGYSEGRGALISCHSTGSRTTCTLGYEGPELPVGRLRVVVSPDSVTLRCFSERGKKVSCNRW